MKRRLLLLSILLGASALIIMLVLITGKDHTDLPEACRHEYSVEVIEKADCTKVGLVKYTCSKCGDTGEVSMPKTGHALSDGIPDDGALSKGACPVCGSNTLCVHYGDSGASLVSPVKSRADKVFVSASDDSGFRYQYILYCQKAEYEKHSEYINKHGCSTCALATILGAVYPPLAGITPDRVITEVEPAVFSSSEMKANFENKGNMPVSLSGITRILDYYGIDYEPPCQDPSDYGKQITDHLKKGDPVIVTISKGRKIGVSRSVHTILLLGIDKDGHVIVGDSVIKSRKKWGDNGLVKPGRITVSDILDCFATQTGWSVCKDKGGAFYSGKKDIGFLLVSGGSSDQ